MKIHLTMGTAPSKALAGSLPHAGPVSPAGAVLMPASHGQHGGRGRRRPRRPSRLDPPPAVPSMATALAQFTAAGLVAMLVLAGVGTLVLRRAGASEALHEARVVTQVHEQAIRPHVTDALLAGDPTALADLDRVVRATVLSDRVERVKLWAPDGRVVYADDLRLVGQRFQLGEDELRTLRTGQAYSDVSDLSAPENRLEPSGHRLLEVYQRTHTPSGAPLLFEGYLRYDSVIASGNRIWTDFAPAMLVTLIALQMLQLPLAWRLTRRLQHGERERAALHRHALEAADAERRRITGDLHDGVVQTLAGASFALAAAAVDVTRPEVVPTGTVVRTITNTCELIRRSIVELRSLLVDIYPPNLREVGLGGALADLLAPLPAKGVMTRLFVQAGLELSPKVEQLLYRAAQESVRNVLTHAGADNLEVEVRRERGMVVLDVRDDGRGFVVSAQSTASSHFGLRLLAEMVGRLDGRLHVDSVPGRGTDLHLEVPAV